ncbi:dihydropteroate synthase [Candidatus Thiodictyon syntrophicum]|jgi:dihydropteroate synthase|uniref:Dihydropteroate synthase n=1 Tax=Candidatus Thiodictyon syntrophicum TaxID=1166950 RepID=A0A2K8UEN6_9GAMM|nr:dihydropteroate synthase [Candidatus Thiodictyon syntrophicum]AUB84038.1 dihydropteroate synthase [Candidatus Thiodictyon syntrophicum]
MSSLDCGGRRLDLTRPRVMGILNVTPDSFSDGGRFQSRPAALERAQAMVAAGADLIDIGGESTRPGAQPVPLTEELARVIPVVAALAGSLAVPISVDTSKPEVMRAAVAAGAGLINDVCALRAPGALESAARLGVPVCLMHLLGEPGTMQVAPGYGDVVAEVRAFLAARVDACIRAGIPRERLLIDPGFGFGKTLAHNLALLAHLEVLTDLGVPVLVGLSRKSMVGALTGRAPGERLAASLAAALLAVQRGALILRVHDVAETRDALLVWEAVRAAASLAWQRTNGQD